MALVRQGADRQEMHEVIREHALASWAKVQAGDGAIGAGLSANPLPQLLAEDRRIQRHVAPERVMEMMDASAYVGDAPWRARKMAVRIREAAARDLAGPPGSVQR
jgi:adenylosuccinate lyase